ncbi:bifunctional alpha/beta hydrolase/class I SAM-dependent methyltransferase [Kaarinaea lacus]
MNHAHVIDFEVEAVEEGLTHNEHQFMCSDGTRLFYRAWHPSYVRNRALILFHGGHEHSGRCHEMVEQLDLQDVSVFAWDARGHGRSDGVRGYARHFHQLVEDADSFIRHISETFGIAYEDMVLMGHSVGSVIISTWLHDYAPRVRGAILGSPAFNVKLYVPFALPALKLWQRLKPTSFVNSYVKPGMLTHDIQEAQARHEDPLISPQIAVPVLTSLFDTAQRVIDDAGVITTPVLLLSAGSDHVVHRKAQARFFANLGSTFKHMETLDGFYHEVFHEQHRHRPITMAREFIQQLYHQPLADPDPAEIQSISERRYELLQRSLPVTSWKKYHYATSRFLLSTLGRLSDGVRLGWESGFDSGRTLDYVYRNQAKGVTPLGRLIDRQYLDAIGWQGIRQRGKNLQTLLNQVIRMYHARGDAVHIMDVASGPGRYLLTTLQDLDEDKTFVTCRDWDTKGLQQGQALAGSLSLRNVIYERADAFAPEAYENLKLQADIVVVSGLYELFSDNQKIATSLQGIASAIEEGGYLIYTNQPFHPQQELIARTLINREQQPWVMRLRSQQEMNQLVRSAGFTPLQTLMDEHGIFTVTLARKQVA